MKKINDSLSKIKNIFCQQHNSMESVDCVELMDAARRTCGSTGRTGETNHFMKYNPKK